MATRNVNLTLLPTNLETALSLESGKWYVLQNTDANARIFLRNAAVTPTGAARRGMVLQPLRWCELQPDDSSATWWAWTDRVDGASAVITERT